MTLPVGLALPTTPGLTSPPALSHLARAAEQLGYAHLWVRAARCSDADVDIREVLGRWERFAAALGR